MRRGLVGGAALKFIGCLLFKFYNEKNIAKQLQIQ